MSSIRYVGIGLLALVFMGGCESTPTVTRTGDVKDIVIGDKLFAAEVSVNPGDEVRWVNKRTAPVRIVFLSPVSDTQLSCNNTFGRVLTPRGTATLSTNQTASACFQNPGSYPYVVRMESALTTEEINVPGIIQVEGTMGDAAAQTREQRNWRTSSQAVLSAIGRLSQLEGAY